MLETGATQQDRLLSILKAQPLARSNELRAQGITATTIARAEANGLITRVSRGLYQSLDSEIDPHQSLAEVAKQVPQGVICMVSALAYHGLTDQMPRRVWVAIEKNGWTPSVSYPPIKVVRFSPRFFDQGIEHTQISGVDVPIYSIPKTLADVFRNPRLVDRSVAIESLRSALTQRKTTPSAIYQAAEAGGTLNTLKPYLEALTFNG
ncbi:type IV toxin-antitoxin system AbiEi family antitoxin domain-containing protein [Asticcacaulis sp. BYS171W]|uniref:Type IV toxin-antitoxin system AbiEi family antitoxin domain-containing protein n=1 Tax=Asticcacaulis aquaticus TaxID=2984212 RepID=A0ABT5HUM6_9CAUL|nr:type IV toxin-antitoxin system AbiEi family antitoxin domain-containing protein [Asticcacaulis aquaticus]MDC7683771.1 type IV toxin-antitoxin system AbiEi family antitoxin domain-containing protein [Asticcacaulis aquaticus]